MANTSIPVIPHLEYMANASQARGHWELVHTRSCGVACWRWLCKKTRERKVVAGRAAHGLPTHSIVSNFRHIYSDKCPKPKGEGKAGQVVCGREWGEKRDIKDKGKRGKKKEALNGEGGVFPLNENSFVNSKWVRERMLIIINWVLQTT